MNIKKNVVRLLAVVFIFTAIFSSMSGTIVHALGYTVSIGCLSAADSMNSGDAVFDAYFNDITVTSVTVKATYLSPEILYSGTINPVTKSITIPGLANGSYVVSLSRIGFLVKDIDVTVSGSNQNIGDKSLLAGDIIVDGSIDVADLGTLLSVFGSTYGDANYYPGNDFNVDGSVDIADIGMLLSNFGEPTYPWPGPDFGT